MPEFGNHCGEQSYIHVFRSVTELLLQLGGKVQYQAAEACRSDRLYTTFSLQSWEAHGNRTEKILGGNRY